MIRSVARRLERLEARAAMAGVSGRRSGTNVAPGPSSRRDSYRYLSISFPAADGLTSDLS